MATIEESVLVLQAKLEEAQKQLLEKQEREKLARESTWVYNIDAIKSNIEKATAAATRRVRSGGRPNYIQSYYTEQMVGSYLQPFMASVLKCLQRLDERIQQLENFHLLENKTL